MRLIFATNNQHKVNEIRSVLPGHFEVVTLREAGIEIDIPEPHDTLEKNAEEKAVTIFRMTGENTFSEDTGLEVPALNNEPGVHSARYAGEGRSFEDNIKKLLLNIEKEEDRRARFRTSICLILNGNKHFFEGICEGSILKQPRGRSGFGYDPVFVPNGSDRSFAEMTMEEKNSFSHRKKAIDQVVEFLNQQS